VTGIQSNALFTFMFTLMNVVHYHTILYCLIIGHGEESRVKNRLFCNTCRLEMVRCVDGVIHLVTGKCLPMPTVTFSRLHW